MKKKEKEIHEDLGFFFKKLNKGVNSLIQSSSVEGRQNATPVVQDSVRQIRKILGGYAETALKKFFCEGVVRIGGYVIYNDNSHNSSYSSKKKFLLSHENWARW